AGFELSVQTGSSGTPTPSANAPRRDGSNVTFARVAWEEITAVVAGGETIVRTALPLLEESGLLRRHSDIPRSFTLFEAAGARSESLLSSAAEQGGAWGPAELSAYCGIGLPDLEPALLQSQDEGVLGYRSAQRDVLLEIVPAEAGARQRMEGMLRRRTAEA